MVITYLYRYDTINDQEARILYDKSYIDFLIHFHGTRDYFECHEILEEHWKQAPAPLREKKWVGLIQIAVALYHQRRRNFEGAAKMLASSIKILESDEFSYLGLDKALLLKMLQTRLQDILQHKPYESFNLPIIDEKLLQLCHEECDKLHWKWGTQSDLSDNYLIHKHTLRDRSDVVEERNLSIEERKHRS